MLIHWYVSAVVQSHAKSCVSQQQCPQILLTEIFEYSKKEFRARVDSEVSLSWCSEHLFASRALLFIDPEVGLGTPADNTKPNKRMFRNHK